MRIVIGGAIVLLLVVATVLMWPRDRAPTLPDIGPGARRVTGAANLGRVDASGESPSRR